MTAVFPLIFATRMRWGVIRVSCRLLRRASSARVRFVGLLLKLNIDIVVFYDLYVRFELAQFRLCRPEMEDIEHIAQMFLKKEFVILDHGMEVGIGEDEGIHLSDAVL